MDAKNLGEKTRASKFTEINNVRKAVLICFVFALFGCSLGEYPTENQVVLERQNIPQLETIADGLSYLAVVRDNLVQKRRQLLYWEGAFDTGIVGSLTAFSLGTALKWGHDANVITGITSAAIIGVDSALNLRQQEAIINKGLDALNCVQAQVEATYAVIRPFDNALKPVRLDVANLESAITALGPQALPTDLAAAQANLAKAKVWLSIESVPAENVGAAVKIVVDNVLQTTVDQLNSQLPDGSAFAKISFAPPSGGMTPPKTTDQSQRLVSLRVGGANFTSTFGVLPTLTPAQAQARATFEELGDTLTSDMTAAANTIAGLGAVPTFTKLPTFNATSCPAISLTPSPPPPLQVAQLQVSFASPRIALARGSKLVARISGGTPPYTPLITGDSTTTPGNISTRVNNSSLTLTNSTAIAPGTYTLTITDANQTSQSATFTAVTGPPTQPPPPAAQQLLLSLNPNSTTLVSGAAGSLTVTVNNGTPPYTNISIGRPFAVGPSSTGTFALNYPADIPPGSYVLSVKDKNGASGSVKLTVAPRSP